MKFHYKIDPDTLSDDDWCIWWNDLEWIFEQQLHRDNQLLNVR